MTDRQAILRARFWARRYLQIGLNPLPMCRDRKHPCLKHYTRFWDWWISGEWPRRWWTPNIQIVLGTQAPGLKLCVLDIDGPEGIREWHRWLIRDGGATDLWTWQSGAPVRDDTHCDSFHLWFRIPYSLPSLPTTTLWQPDPRRGHPQIRLLGDRSLAVAPYSIHPERGTVYEWTIGPSGTDRLPAVLPDWIRTRVDEVRSRVAPPKPRPRPHPASLSLPSGPDPVFRHYQRDQVLYALGDQKHKIAEAYGLEVKRFPNLAGFHDCRAPDRPDNDWSCTIDPRTGVFSDFAHQPPRRLSFFSLLMLLDPVTFPCYTLSVDKLGAYVFGGSSCPKPILDLSRSSPSPSTCGARNRRASPIARSPST